MIKRTLVPCLFSGLLGAGLCHGAEEDAPADPHAIEHQRIKGRGIK